MATTKEYTKSFDEGTEFLSAEERDTYMRTMRHIADTAINAGCGQLIVSDLQVIQALEEKNEAMFEEWLYD